MNTNASMFNRFVAVILDLLTFLGYAAGFMMLTFTASSIDAELQFESVSRNELIKTGVILVVIYFILDVLLTRIFATTPGKLSLNCDVDFHMGNTMLYNIIRSFVKIVCLFTVVLGFFSYISGTTSPDSQTFHDKIAKTNVTDSTRMPRALGVLIVLVGIGILVYFVVTYHGSLGINPSLNLPNYKIFDV
ncbi:MAG: RDD family protein [Clostridiales bacterium]|nr:RDD family protein [Clostridiales bacterium]